MSDQIAETWALDLDGRVFSPYLDAIRAFGLACAYEGWNAASNDTENEIRQRITNLGKEPER